MNFNVEETKEPQPQSNVVIEKIEVEVKEIREISLN